MRTRQQQQNAAIWAEVHRKFAYAIAGVSAAVALVLVPWGVYWSLTGRRESAIGAFVPVVLLGLISWAALRGARRDVRPPAAPGDDASGGDG